MELHFAFYSSAKVDFGGIGRGFFEANGGFWDWRRGECIVTAWRYSIPDPKIGTWGTQLLNSSCVMKMSSYYPYRSAITAGTGAPFGEDRYPVTVFLALTLLTTISNNTGSLPL